MISELLGVIHFFVVVPIRVPVVMLAKGRLALRILAFAVDVLPESIRKDYADDLAEVRGIDPHAKRHLERTWRERKTTIVMLTFVSYGMCQKKPIFFTYGQIQSATGDESFYGFLRQGPLTWTEQLIKDELAVQSVHGENLPRPQRCSCALQRFVDFAI